MIVEVLVAPIPGLMLYAPGGIIFGGFQGGLLSLVGNTLGAGIACAAVRGIGDAWMRNFFSAEKLEVTQNLLEKRGVWLIFLLRANPLTSSDLVSYATGLTYIPTWKVMVATAFGMAPLCFAQAYLADNIMRQYPWLLYPLLGFCVIYLIAVILIAYRIRKDAGSKS
ncbi:VTT domain-containing protein [bacterium]|nr:VTT domain-containing protein [bacterium]